MPTIPAWVRIVLAHFGDALEEFFYLVLFALMPLWLTGAVQMLYGENFLGHLGTYLYSGEALLISAASVGPLIYAILKEYDKKADGFSRPFPAKIILVPTIFLVCLISAGVLGRKASHLDWWLISPNALWTMSLIISLISITIWFAVTMIRNSLDTGAPNIMRQDTEDFVSRYGDQ